MKLTPLDIKKQEFTRAFRGVDPHEVHSFLQMVADQWSNLLDENSRLEQKLRDLDGKLEHYRKIEEALQEALETARDNSHKTIENAQREAQIIIREARNEAEEIRKKGLQDHKRLKHDITKVSGRRDEVIARLRAFLMSEIELLARFEGQDHIGSGYVRLHSSERKQIESRSYEEDIGFRDYDKSPSKSSGSSVQDRNFSVDLPVDEEEVPFEEDLSQDSPGQSEEKPSKSSKPSSSSFSFDEYTGSSDEHVDDDDDVDADQLDFIKSTVKSSEPEERSELFKSSSQDVNGRQRSEQKKESFTLNDSFSRREPQRESRQQRPPKEPFGSNRDDSGKKPEQPKEGWIVRPVVDENKSNPSGNHGFTSQIFGADDDDDLSATPEEIEKIRRILNDLD